MTGKYYWLKLNEHFFDDDAIIFLKSQPNGYEYIYLWQRLLLKSLRSERKDECGFLRFSETLPYTPELLSEIFKMNVDVVRVGIALFQKIGLVQVMDDGTLYLDSVQRLVGKESDSAERMRRLRDKKKLLSCGDTTVTCDVTPRTCDANKEEEVEEDIDSIPKRFRIPTESEVQSYLATRSITYFTASQFIDFYTSRGWLIGKNKMKDWKAAVRTWESRAKSDPKRPKTTEELYG